MLRAARFPGVTPHLRTTDVAERVTSLRTSLAWLIKLRWHAATALALAVFVLDVELPVVPLASLAAVVALSNVGLVLWLRSGRAIARALIGAVLLGDVLVLTAALASAGGVSNPFVFLYVVEAVVAALLLTRRWVFVVVIASAAGHVWLARLPPGPIDFRADRPLAVVAFVVTAFVVGLQTARVVAELRARQAETARAEKLASLATLAAGAAHELGTPLSTIAIATKELGALVRGDEATRELAVLAGEVERCRTILRRMAARAGETTGELPEPTSAGAIVAAVRRELGDPARLVGEIDATLSLTAPRRGLAVVVASLVTNALHASAAVHDAATGEAPPVTLEVSADGDRVRFVVRDAGPGIPSDVRARIGEPFFTTKPPGQGMGLGLFLADAFARQCGGSFAIESSDGRGTTVALTLPRSVG